MRSASCSTLEELHPGAQTHPSTISVVETVIGLPCRLAGTCDVGQSAASVTATVAKHVPAAQEQSANSPRFCWCSCRCPVLVLVMLDHCLACEHQAHLRHPKESGFPKNQLLKAITQSAMRALET